MSKPKGSMCFVEDLHKTAQQHGYTSWQKLLVDKYAAVQSTRKVGIIFERSGPWVNTQLKRMGIKLRKRGGRVYTKWLGKNIPCPKCKKRYVSVMGLCNVCYAAKLQKKQRLYGKYTHFDDDYTIGHGH